MTVALRERLAVLDDRLLDLLGQVARDDAGRRRREAEVLEDGDDLRVEVLQLPERGVHREYDALALVGLGVLTCFIAARRGLSVNPAAVLHED